MAEIMTRPCEACGGTGRRVDDAAMGAELRCQRLERGLALQVVADRMGLSRAYVHDLEQGNRKWKPGMVTAYEAALVGGEPVPVADEKGRTG